MAVELKNAAFDLMAAESPVSQMLQCARRFENRSEAVIRKRSLRLRYDGSDGLFHDFKGLNGGVCTMCAT